MGWQLEEYVRRFSSRTNDVRLALVAVELGEHSKQAAECRPSISIPRILRSKTLPVTAEDREYCRNFIPSGQTSECRVC